MALTKEFISAWSAWQHANAPIINSRQRRFDAPTYDIEMALDHVASNVYTLGLWAIAGKRLNYAQLASEKLAELDRVNAELKDTRIEKPIKQEFTEYILLIRVLLEEMRKVSYNQDAV